MKNSPYLDKPLRPLAEVEALRSSTEDGPAADIRLRDIVSVSDCSPAAVDAWEAGLWSR